MAGVNVAGRTPVPVSVTVCGLLGALSVNVSAPVRAPNTVGVKVTFTVHLAAAARVVPQVLDKIAKLPLMAILLMLSGPPPLLVRVTVLAVLVVLMTWLPKLKLAGDSVTTGLPLRLNVAVTDFDAFMVTEQVPVPVQAPLQPANMEPEAGLAVRVTAVPVLKLALQVPGQSIPLGLLVTVPDPVPARLTVRGWVLPLTVNVAAFEVPPPGEGLVTVTL